MYNYPIIIASDLKKVAEKQAVLSLSVPIWVAWLFVFTVFSREIGYASIAGIDFDLISYTFFILYFLIQLRSLYINQYVVGILFLIFVSSLISKIYLEFQLQPLFKQFIPISLLYICSYDIFYRISYKKLFQLYFRISYLTAIFGLIQFWVKFFFGIKLLTDYSQIFVDSIAPEPSHYAIIILPAVTYSIFYFRQYKLQAFILILALLLTTSSTAYLVLLVVLLLIYRRIQYLLFIGPILFLIFNNFLFSYDKFYIRYLGFASYFENRNFNRIYAATSVSFLSNAEVALASIKQSPLLGSGLGGHEEMYAKHYASSAFRFSYIYGINAASAHSLLIRIISELGIVGFVCYIWGLIKSLLLGADDYHRVISIACLSHFLGKALKLGGYFDYGTPFFAMLLFFNFLDYRSKTKFSN